MSALAQLCERRIAARVDDMNLSPSIEAFLDLGLVAETLLVSPASRFEASRAVIADAVQNWVRSALLQRILIAGAHYLYHGAVLANLAFRQGCWGERETELLQRPIMAGLAGRGEISGLPLACAAAHLAELGIPLKQLEQESPVGYTIDKSVLRRRFDERDIISLLQLARLHQLGGLAEPSRPRLVSHILLLQAAAANQLNWMASLILAIQVLASPDERGLLPSARARLRDGASGIETLIAPPAIRGSENAFLEKAELGLKLRGSLAVCMLLDGR